MLLFFKTPKRQKFNISFFSSEIKNQNLNVRCSLKTVRTACNEPQASVIIHKNTNIILFIYPRCT